MDLVVGASDGTLRYWERVADGSLVAREGAASPFDGIALESYSAPAVVDWDGDGQPIIFYPYRKLHVP